ncbi:zinc finger and SCAN domain-containing protein 2-like isoform X2 [Acanthochromis polyacanthus]|uniref:zinc finger and SCAN domain-containing protein 2-like isoform X2 n=1 Tax=Acanthochromis polyacanthus TaxID=80966 RepID=UPI00223446CF|nr:zinc finger and SCAN domain-containing protein 2-like isoform X2 [Acanthochromis polyacanthus]
MCSVVGCDSFRRNAKRFKLPEDPEERLEWVQFVLEVNGQRLKESSWTDITICSEHFTNDCFVDQSLQLRSGSVPSLCVKSEPEEAQEKLQHVDSVENTDAPDDLETSDSKPFCPENTDRVFSGSGQIQQKVLSRDLNKERAALLQVKGKYLVNESCLLELFVRKCPSCGSKLQMEKVTCGLLIILNQRCLQCDYRNQWKSQINADVPTAEDRNPAGGTEVTAGIQQEVPADEDPNSAILSDATLSEEESNPSDDAEKDGEGEDNSDGEWNPEEDFSVDEELLKDSEDETEDEGENFDSVSGLKINELCAECGSFFNVMKSHTCEHKIKPYSCNICGKRYVTELLLKKHSKIHDETYEHPCRFCYVTFKTRVDKLKHEQTHLDKKDPYKCPDCPETFTTSKKRRAHLANHRAPMVFKCGVCEIDFKDVHHLQRHSVVHTGLKPYKCSVCHRGFSQSSHLKSHMRLHTGERPYKCQHCDKSFNHNVSLKSHIQRYHASSSGCKRRKGKVDIRANVTGDAEGNGNKRDTDSEFDRLDKEQETEEKVQKKGANKPKNKRRRTGRPVGRPKRYAESNLAEEVKRQTSNAKTSKSKVQKLKKTGSSDEESEDKQSDSDLSFGTAEVEAETAKRKNAPSSKRKAKPSSDSDFDPGEETKKQRRSSLNSGKSSGKRRGRPKKNAVV